MAISKGRGRPYHALLFLAEPHVAVMFSFRTSTRSANARASFQTLYIPEPKAMVGRGKKPIKRQKPLKGSPEICGLVWAFLRFSPEVRVNFWRRFFLWSAFGAPKMNLEQACLVRPLSSLPCDPSRHLRESPGLPDPRSQRSLKTGPFGGLPKSPRNPPECQEPWRP